MSLYEGVEESNGLEYNELRAEGGEEGRGVVGEIIALLCYDIGTHLYTVSSNLISV